MGQCPPTIRIDDRLVAFPRIVARPDPNGYAVEERRYAEGMFLLLLSQFCGPFHVPIVSKRNIDMIPQTGGVGRNIVQMVADWE
jgi:hypothetical protein